MERDSFYNLLSTFSISEPIMKKDDFLMELPTGEVVSSKVVLDEAGNIKTVVDELGTGYLPHVWIAEKLGRLSSLARALISTLSSNSAFVSPIGKYELNWSIDSENGLGTDAVCDVITKVCQTNNYWETHVLYLTSNAGEGKTTILEKVATDIAGRYTPGRGKLVIPISLSGKPFIRFEDLVIGTLANKYKFSGYFFPSFISLVKLGFIIPAFDGFEEMFVESPSGEAISAMAEFIKELKGKGTILVAARSAYFEHQNLTTQGKLYDSVSNSPVVFSKVRIDRWRKDEFVSYGLQRALTPGETETLYTSIADKFGVDHPVLTRAVLVKKIFDSFEDSGSIIDFLNIASSSYNEFYKKFLYTIVEREAGKWLLKGKSLATPVLSVTQHLKLLSFVAKEMWISRSEILRDDVLSMITDLFIESEKLGAEAASQVRKRIKDHAILKMAEGNKNYFEFDHQDFYQYFLGYSILLSIKQAEYEDVYDLGRKGRFSKTTLDACSFGVVEAGLSHASEELLKRMPAEQKSSYARENVALLVLLNNQFFNEAVVLSNIVFDTEPFDAIKLQRTTFRDCIVSSIKTSCIGADLVFDNCKILEVELDEIEPKNSRLIGDTEISSLHNHLDDTIDYSPNVILAKLNALLKITSEDSTGQLFAEYELKPADERIATLEKVLRVFYNRIEVNEDTLKTKLSVRFGQFWEEMLPGLMGVVFDTVPYRGSGTQSRLRIICKMENIQKALEVSGGDYQVFLSEVLKKKSRRKE